MEFPVAQNVKSWNSQTFRWVLSKQKPNGLNKKKNFVETILIFISVVELILSRHSIKQINSI